MSVQTASAYVSPITPDTVTLRYCEKEPGTQLQDGMVLAVMFDLTGCMQAHVA